MVASLLFVGCEVGPNYSKPKEKVPKHFGEVQATTAPSQVTNEEFELSEWWTTFNDRELNSLIHRALKQNLDLQQAESRIRQARYERVVATGELFPEVDATGGYQHARGSKNVVIPQGAFGGSSGGKSGGGSKGSGSSTLRPPGVGTAQMSDATAQPGGPVSPLGNGGFPGVETDLYQVGFDSVWELDIFGGTRRNIEAATADLAAAVFNRRAVEVSMLAEVARTYVELRGLQLQKQIAEQNLTDQQTMIRIIREKQRVGLSNYLNIDQQNVELANTAAAIPQLDAQLHSSIHALGILLAENPDALINELTPSAQLPDLPPRVPIGLPSELLRRRPDIREAERKLAAATARIGAAKAQLFPQFSITGQLGLDSSQPKELLDWSSRYFLLSPGVSWPIFDAGQISGKVKVQRELAKQALIAYRQTILQALKEVDDAIANYRQEQLREASLVEAVNSSKDSVRLAREQFNNGVVDFIVVLDAQRSMLASEDTLAQSRRTVDADLVALYKALGGGWEKTDLATDQHR
ncbi:MAG TPA: efflux transporter outer membrane subunit [Tepidisphaeraceae bacterium]